VSEAGFGAWAIGGNRYGNSYGPTDDAESIRAVRRAVELGCNCFDTADVYGHGHSEELLGEALADRRGEAFIITKVGGNFYNRDVHPLLRERVAQAAGVPYTQIPPDVPLPVTHDANFSSDYVRFALGRSLERLQTDYVDLLLLHNPPQAQIADLATYGVLEDLKQERKIRAYGVSVHSPEEGLAAIQATMPDVVELVYNLARREAESRFFPAARAADIGVIAREPLANGFSPAAMRRTAPGTRATSALVCRSSTWHSWRSWDTGCASCRSARGAAPRSWRSSSCWTIPLCPP
jgi:aryl-alcohol dehydrogenase-like predicted oxidoreductase